MKKNNVIKNINKFLKKYFLQFTIVSFLLIVIALIFKKFSSLELYANIAFILATIFSGIPIFFRAFMALKHKVISIELLVSIAVIGALVIKEFSECAIVTFLFQFGNYLEQKTMQKTRSAIKELTELAPKFANKIIDGKVQVVDIDDVDLDDILIVKEGDMIPVDGIILNGEGYLKEASITGESLPQYKVKNDLLYAGTILDSGYIEMKANRVGDDTTFAKIISLIEEASDLKSPIEKFIDKFSKYYTPIVILLAVLTLIILRITTGVYNIDKAITVLVLACPGALVIGSPIASVAGIGRGAKDNILFKGGDSLFNFSKSKVFMFDKTGTLTKGDTKVLSSKYYGDDEKIDLLNIASLEKSSKHPIGKSLIEYALNKNIQHLDNIKVVTNKGQGIFGTICNNNYLIGNENYLLNNKVKISIDQDNYIKQIKQNGSSIILVSKNQILIYIFEIGDEIKSESRNAILSLKKLGVKKFIMLTGDNYDSAKYVADKIGIDEIHASLLPEEKLSVIKEYESNNYKVTFIGDGINDAPSLALASISIAMGSGTDVALETSSIVLMKSSLEDLVYAYKLSKKTIIITYENIIIAILTVILLLIGLFMDFIHMGIGMLIHEASIFIVILNSMRLLIKKGNRK